MNLHRTAESRWNAIRQNVMAQKTRSCAQGNCSAKSLAASLSSTSHDVRRRGGSSGGGEGGPAGDSGAGDISVQLPYMLHYHMVLRPEGTSHN